MSSLTSVRITEAACKSCEALQAHLDEFCARHCAVEGAAAAAPTATGAPLPRTWRSIVAGLVSLKSQPNCQIGQIELSRRPMYFLTHLI